MQVKADSQKEEKKDITPMVHLIMKAVALAMGVGVVVLSVLNELDTNSGIPRRRIKNYGGYRDEKKGPHNLS